MSDTLIMRFHACIPNRSPDTAPLKENEPLFIGKQLVGGPANGEGSLPFPFIGSSCRFSNRVYHSCRTLDQGSPRPPGHWPRTLDNARPEAVERQVVLPFPRRDRRRLETYRHTPDAAMA